jgi:hypothetical protein
MASSRLDGHRATFTPSMNRATGTASKRFVFRSAFVVLKCHFIFVMPFDTRIFDGDGRLHA